MTGLSLPADAVAIRRARVRGVAETTVRRQLAQVATPDVQRFVFVRRVRLRTAPHGIGAAMRTALTRLADDGQREVLTYPDFPALVVAAVRAARAGSLGASWHWRMLGLASTARPGEVAAALLAEHPLEAGTAVAALAEAGLLADAWRDMPPAGAAALVRALAAAMGFTPPAWPPASTSAGPPSRQPVLAEPETAAAPPAWADTMLARAAALWAPVLAPLPPDSASVLAALVLVLLRWSPGTLHISTDPLWPVLAARVAGRQPGASLAVAVPPPDVRPTADGRDGPSPGLAGAPVDDTGTAPSATTSPSPLDATAETPTAAIADTPRGETIATHWGGLLFLINALNRLDITALLADSGPAAPTGWRVLHDLGIAFGMPEDEPLAQFLRVQDLDTTVPPALLADLMTGFARLYEADGPWPLPLRQLAWLTVTETHLDLSLGAATVDLALRLSGLDLDPAWVPWLGRVVRFHYDRMQTYGTAARGGAESGRLDGDSPAA